MENTNFNEKTKGRCFYQQNTKNKNHKVKVSRNPKTGKIKRFLQQVFALKVDIKTQKSKNLRKIKLKNFDVSFLIVLKKMQRKVTVF